MVASRNPFTVSTRYTACGKKFSCPKSVASLTANEVHEIPEDLQTEKRVKEERCKSKMKFAGNAEKRS